MTAVHCNTGRNSHFQPSGRIRIIGAPLRKNPVERWGAVWSARLFVGFNVGDEPTWTVDDLIPIVKTTLTKQGNDPDATFLVQKGLFTSRKTGTVTTENGAQVIIIGPQDKAWLPFLATVPRKFYQDIVELGEVIARDMQQELVIVEFQRAGVVKQTLGVTP